MAATVAIPGGFSVCVFLFAKRTIGGRVSIKTFTLGVRFGSVRLQLESGS